MLSEPLVKLNSVYVKVQEALLHLRGDLLVGDTGVVGKAIGGTARIFDAPAFYAQQVRQILRKYGTDAHVFVPGVGYMNGFAAGNYLESTGNTNASVDGAVGLVLDAAGSVGAELVAGQAWATGSVNTSISGGNTVVFNGAASGAVGTASIPVALNKTYQITFTVSGLTAGQIGVDAGGASTYPNIGANGTHTIRTVCAGGAGAVYVVSKAAGTTASVQVTSIREITGTHATQATTANKPILRRGIVNLQPYSNDLTNAAWTRVNCVPTLVQDTDQVYVSRLAENTAATAQHTLNSSNISSVGSFTLAAIIAPNGRNVAMTFNFPGLSGSRYWYGGAQFNLANGNFQATTPVLAAGAPVQYNGASVLSLGGGYLLCVVNVTTTESTTFNSSIKLVNGYTTATDPLYTGDGASGVFVKASGLFQGTLTAQQILAAGGIPLTTTAPASSQYGAYAWQFDGSNDSLALPGPLFQMTDDHCVISAANADADAPNANMPVCSPSQGAGIVTRYGQISFDKAGGCISASWYDGTNYDNLNNAPYQTGVPFVASARKVGAIGTLRVNGVLKGTKTLTANGVATQGVIGRYLNSGEVFKGLVYPQIVIKGTVSDGDLSVLEKWLGSIAGVPIA